MEKTTSYYIFTFTFLLLNCQMLFQATSSTRLSLASDQSALLAFKAHITLDTYGIVTSNWTNSSSVCSWIGVTCDTYRHQRVVAVNISNMNLIGTIPPQLGNLSFLVSLDLESNSFGGTIPRELGMLKSLQYLDLRQNKLTGNLPREVGNLTTLKRLDLTYNNFTGDLPREIDKLDHLEELVLAANNFTGLVPPELFNISTLQYLSLSVNGLSGSLPTSLGYQLPNLKALFLTRNYFSGAIPHSLSNCTKLRVLALGRNKFIGFVPDFLGNLRLLERLQLQGNHLRADPSSSELSFITSLTNCRYLTQLTIDKNPIAGVIPTSIGNLSTMFTDIFATDCEITGTIPVEIGNLSNLVTLSLGLNKLSGNIPITIKHLHSLQALALSDNKLRGSIPQSLCDLSRLNIISLAENQLSGPIPECLGNITSLRQLHLGSNMLSSSIPSSLWRLKDLLRLDLSNNSLSGSLPPEIGNLMEAININMSVNQLIEYIPSTIGNLQNLADLSMAHNRLKGSIPMSVGSMINLETLDISYNNLSGPIPKSLETLQHLDYFNVSFNALIGEIPTAGPFRNFTIESFKANDALCGVPRFHVPPCRIVSKQRNMWEKTRFAVFMLSGIFAIIIAILLIFMFIRYRRNKTISGLADVPEYSPTIERISYLELKQATEQFSESNLLGMGSFGSVYKGILRDGKVFAVKVFNSQPEAAFKSFDVECNVLRNIRHRNLTKVISSCSNDGFKALILEYMPNGSLEKLLYSRNYCLDVVQRVNIMIDVASALEYMHHGYSTPVVHCDLKPSNVLLDEEMIAHVSDFGIAKLLGAEESVSHTHTLATMGYIAPEYGLEGLVSIRCDVYSFGIMLMETFTRKRPSDDMFVGDLSLKSWVESSLSGSLIQVIDANLLDIQEEYSDKKLKCVSSILELALKCSAGSPSDRINMKEVVAKLQKIKRQFSEK